MRNETKCGRPNMALHSNGVERPNCGLESSFLSKYHFWERMRGEKGRRARA